MPAYVANSAVALYPGDSYKVLNAETPSADTASTAVSPQPSIVGALAGYSVTYQFASAPASVTIYVQEADDNADASFVTIDTLSSTTGGKTSYSGNFTKFVRVVAHAQSGGGELTVSIGR